MIMSYVLHSLLSSRAYVDLENISNNIQDDAFRGPDSEFPTAFHNQRLFVFQKTNLDFKEFMVTNFKNKSDEAINRDEFRSALGPYIS